MRRFKNLYLAAGLILIGLTATKNTTAQRAYHEMYRPQVHFSPKEKWMNDPNGMVFYNGVYHLFVQYHPKSTVWGPMHWAHATSADLVHWHPEPIALYPDSLGYIFSGSAVVDQKNTTGFGQNGQVPLVAIFTSHDPKAKKEKRINVENQSIAYSLDEGKTWVKYPGNPVLKNPGIIDFRDPKVMWYEAGNKWIMTLATKDRVTFYSSPDLKAWKKESEFGSNAGAHDGVWECPDLFPLDDNGKQVWVLIVNVGSGGPNKGSATQYFTGEFDGNKFTTSATNTKWMDYGPDEYAGITWSNTGDRKIFLGWMSNWMYASEVPTEKWRGAATLPRELHIKHVANQVLVTSQPVAELSKIETGKINAGNITVTGNYDLAHAVKTFAMPCKLSFSIDTVKDFSLMLSNVQNEKVIFGYDKAHNQYYIDRTFAGKLQFHKEFAARHVAPRLSDQQKMNFSVIIDQSSLELFADDGLTVMTELFFPGNPYTELEIQTKTLVVFKKVEYAGLKSIWP